MSDETANYVEYDLDELEQMFKDGLTLDAHVEDLLKELRFRRNETDRLPHMDGNEEARLEQDWQRHQKNFPDDIDDPASGYQGFKAGWTDQEYTITGIMHFIDKWLEGDELKLDPVNRAAAVREKTLNLVETWTEYGHAVYTKLQWHSGHSDKIATAKEADKAQKHSEQRLCDLGEEPPS